MAQAKSKTQRAQRERERLYQARRDLHDRQRRRRRRDDVVVSLVGAVVILGAVGAQFAFYEAGPGAVEPEPATTTDAPETPQTPLPIEE
ncbi:MAG: dioxygenase [Microbacterium sp.]